jgi:GMP reductase
MARSLGPEMMTCLHKYHSADDLIAFFSDEAAREHTFLTVGIRDEDLEKLRQVAARTRLHFLCVDAANGYTKFFVDRVKAMRHAHPDVTIMAGNVATPEMVQELLISGAADIVKIGIGPGSVCTTRIMTGIGYPQLSAIIECADAAHGLRGHVCADGGCRTPGDVVKAFAAGADFVMLGGMLAGHDECGGPWVAPDDHRAGMRFYGMSSRIAMEKYAGGVQDYRACEGKETIVTYKGPVRQTLQEITGGILALSEKGSDPLRAHRISRVFSVPSKGSDLACSVCACQGQYACSRFCSLMTDPIRLVRMVTGLPVLAGKPSSPT